MRNAIKTVLLTILVSLFAGCGGGGGGSGGGESLTIKGKIGAAEFIAATDNIAPSSSVLSTESAIVPTSGEIVPMASKTSPYLKGRINTGIKKYVLIGFYDSITKTFSLAAISTDGKYIEIDGSYSGSGTITKAEATGDMVSGAVSDATDSGVTVKLDDAAEKSAEGVAAGIPIGMQGTWYGKDDDGDFMFVIGAFGFLDHKWNDSKNNYEYDKTESILEFVSITPPNKVERAIVQDSKGKYFPNTFTLSANGSTLTMESINNGANSIDAAKSVTPLDLKVTLTRTK